jgi:radical SAM superfamily enzyme YgiQ (UPF0313 family)
VCLQPGTPADFIDLFILGEGEEVSDDLFDLYKQCKKEKRCKTGIPDSRVPDTGRLCPFAV